MLHPEVIAKKESLMEYLRSLGVEIYSDAKNNYLLEAFVHKSFAADYKENYVHNERLEFLGDGILGAFTNSFLFLDFPGLPESKLTLYKIALVREETLAQVAMDIGLGEYVFISHGEEKMWGREKFSILSDSLEAIIGAIYLDCGSEEAEKFVKKHIYCKVDNIQTVPVKSYKTLIQEYAQKHYKQIPEYRDTENLVSASGNVEQYKSEIFISNKKKSEGFGVSKKKAQEDAAKNLYEEVE